MFDLMKEDLQTIYEKDSSAESRLEVALCYPGFHALQFHRAAHWCYIQGWPTVARVVSSLGRFFTGVEIHPAAKIGRRVFIDHGMGVVIGKSVEIGDDCTIYQGATIGGTDIGRETGKLTIKNNVVVGAGAQILGGVTVGENAQIGPSALVLKSVGASVAVGLPNHIVSKEKTVKGITYTAKDIEKLQELVKKQAEELRELRGEKKETKAATKPATKKVATGKVTPKKATAPKETKEKKVPAAKEEVKPAVKAEKKVEEKKGEKKVTTAQAKKKLLSEKAGKKTSIAAKKEEKKVVMTKEKKAASLKDKKLVTSKAKVTLKAPKRKAASKRRAKAHKAK